MIDQHDNEHHIEKSRERRMIISETEKFLARGGRICRIEPHKFDGVIERVPTKHPLFRPSTLGGS